MVEVGHAGQADLERDGDVALDLLGAPAVGLRDDLDHRRHRVRVGLDVELLVAVEPERRAGRAASAATIAGIRSANATSRLESSAHSRASRESRMRARGDDALAGAEAVRDRQLVAALVLVDRDRAPLELQRARRARCRSATNTTV